MMQNNLKVLLVDDVEFFIDVMRSHFKRTPATILVASGGEEAVSIAMREWPDLIYMDVSMPGMSGIEACKKLKAHPVLKKIPVLLIFTPERGIALKDVQESGCDGCLVKPFGREEFLNLGHRHLFNIERRARRVPCPMTVEFSTNGSKYQGRSVDLSLHGLYVECREKIPLNSRVVASFLLPIPRAVKIEVTGRIAWINQGFPRDNMTLPQGFGIEFQLLDEPTSASILAYLELN